MSIPPQQPSAPDPSSAATAPETSAPATLVPALRSNPLGTVSLVAAILLLLAQLASQLLWPFIPYLTQRIELPYSTLDLFLMVPIVLFALVAAITGIIALLLKGRRRTAAIIGTTLGVTTVAFRIVGAVAAAVATRLLY